MVSVAHFPRGCAPSGYTQGSQIYLLRSNYKCWVFLLPAISVLLLDINYVMGISWNEEH